MKRFLIAYFFSVFFFLTFFSSGFVDSQDGLQYLTIARRIYYDHTFEMPEAEFPKDNIHFNVRTTKEGKKYSPTGLGYSLALLPSVAIEDAFYKTAGVQPLSAFPLQNDWPVLLFASMTNAVFGAMFVVTLYAYLKTFDVDHWPAVGYSLIGMVSTNLFPYTKHTFAQMMFVSFMTLSFYFLRKFGLTKSRKYIAAAAASYGVVILSYNPTYLFPIPAIGMYYLLQRSFSFSRKIPILLNYLKEILVDTVVAVVSIAPFLVVYWWFNTSRFGGGLQTGYGSKGIPLPAIPEAYVFVEGFWGLLFSPGKSIFLFSPLLILLVTHWFKITKRWKNEIFSGLLLLILYLYFIGTFMAGADMPIWHGDSSWGPRYMLPTIPLLYLVVVGIMTRLSRIQKLFIVLPLVTIGLVVQLTGMLLPYQTRFYGLALNSEINGRISNVSEYGNQIPRYSPVFNQFKRLLKMTKNYSTQFNREDYEIALEDGFVRPIQIGDSIWREPLEKSVISFNNSEKKPVTNIEFRFRNHQMQEDGTASAQISFEINGQNLEDEIILSSDSEDVQQFNIEDKVFLGKNKLIVSKKFLSDSYQKKSQALFLQSIHLNGQAMPLDQIDYPYVSPISANLFDAKYDYYGNIENDPWTLWHMHSGIFEETFDLWWLRPHHIWDLPAKWFLGGFLFTVFGWVVSSWLMVEFSKLR